MPGPPSQTDSPIVGWPKLCLGQLVLSPKSANCEAPESEGTAAWTGERSQAWGSGCLGWNPAPLTKLHDKVKSLHLSDLLHSHLKDGVKRRLPHEAAGAYHMARGYVGQMPDACMSVLSELGQTLCVLFLPTTGTLVRVTLMGQGPYLKHSYLPTTAEQGNSHT